MEPIMILACRIKTCRLKPDDCQQKIAPSRLAQIARFRPEDQSRSLIGDLLVLESLRARGITLSVPMQYDRTEGGKPYLSAVPEIHFNVSHSGDWILCASGGTPLGIDIQRERPFRPALYRVLSDSEKMLFQTLDAAESEPLFFDLWCLKEAYCKATGQGLRTPLHGFSVTLSPPSISDEAYRVQHVPLQDKAYHAGLCVAGSAMPAITLTEVLHLS